MSAFFASSVVGYKILRNMTRFFLDYHPEYKGMVDPLVSNPLQYFRVPFSRNGLSKIKYASGAMEHTYDSVKMWEEARDHIRVNEHGSAAIDDFHYPFDKIDYDKIPDGFYITNTSGISLYHNVFPEYNWAIDKRLAKNSFGVIIDRDGVVGSQTSRTTGSMIDNIEAVATARHEEREALEQEPPHFQNNQNTDVIVRILGTE